MSGGYHAHKPVLLEETLQALNIQPGGCYVDGTFGRGGHSAAILQRLGSAGSLYALDKDEAAVRYGQEHLGADQRFHIAQFSFSDLAAFADSQGLTGRVDGLLLDLGVSSPQLDDPGRGFSFLHEGPLDMRMHRGQGVTAAEWLNVATEDEIARVLKEYGEERFARRIARAVVQARLDRSIGTTRELAELIERASPSKERHKHPATRSFQAIRIFINSELDELRSCLEQSLQVLTAGARLVVISFHSLEDRIVKRFMREASLGEQLPKGLPVPEGFGAPPRLRLLGKAVKPSASEVAINPRARSAILRVAEVLA